MFLIYFVIALDWRKEQISRKRSTVCMYSELTQNFSVNILWRKLQRRETTGLNFLLTIRGQDLNSARQFLLRLTIKPQDALNPYLLWLLSSAKHRFEFLKKIFKVFFFWEDPQEYEIFVLFQNCLVDKFADIKLCKGIESLRLKEIRIRKGIEFLPQTRIFLLQYRCNPMS